MNVFAKELSSLARRMRKTRNELRALPRDLEERELAIREDPDLTEESKRIKLRQVRQEERSRQQRLHRELVKVGNEADEYVRRVRTHRPVDEAAQARVHKLLGQEMAPSQILDRALELRDDEMVAALRAEMLWFGDKHGFADSRDTVAACDRALATIGRGGEQETSRGVVQVAKAATAVDEINEFAAKSVTGEATPHDRLRLAYAVGTNEADD